MCTHTSSEDERFFGAIGRLVISWAHLELGLDGVIDILHHGIGGKDHEPEKPRALKRKIKYLRAFIKRHPLPDDAVRGYESLFDAILSAAETRHDIIHGAVIEHAERSGEATLVRVIQKSNRITTKKVNVTTRSILEAANEAQRLGGKTLCWANLLSDSIQALSQQHSEQGQP